MARVILIKETRWTAELKQEATPYSPKRLLHRWKGAARNKREAIDKAAKTAPIYDDVICRWSVRKAK